MSDIPEILGTICDYLEQSDLRQMLKAIPYDTEHDKKLRDVIRYSQFFKLRNYERKSFDRSKVRKLQYSRDSSMHNIQSRITECVITVPHNRYATLSEVKEIRKLLSGLTSLKVKSDFRIPIGSYPGIKSAEFSTKNLQLDHIPFCFPNLEYLDLDIETYYSPLAPSTEDGKDTLIKVRRLVLRINPNALKTSKTISPMEFPGMFQAEYLEIAFRTFVLPRLPNGAYVTGLDMKIPAVKQLRVYYDCDINPDALAINLELTKNPDNIFIDDKLNLFLARLDFRGIIEYSSRHPSFPTARLGQVKMSDFVNLIKYRPYDSCNRMITHIDQKLHFRYDAPKSVEVLHFANHNFANVGGPWFKVPVSLIEVNKSELGSEPTISTNNSKVIGIYVPEPKPEPLTVRVLAYSNKQIHFFNHRIPVTIRMSALQDEKLEIIFHLPTDSKVVSNLVTCTLVNPKGGKMNSTEESCAFFPLKVIYSYDLPADFNRESFIRFGSLVLNYYNIIGMR